METIQQTVRTEFHYPVHFTRRVFSVDNPLLQNVIATGGRAQRTLFVVDRGVSASGPGFLQQLDSYCAVHSEIIDKAETTIVVPGGEAVKNIDDYVDSIRSAVDRFKICRHSFIVAVGGGAVLDMAGFAAATSHRGVRLIRLPSTVLAQNDSGLGVKTSINRFNKKNFLGTFTPPFAVINDLDLLNSLPDRDWRSGLAEAVKVALIKDKSFFDSIEKTADLLSRRNIGAMEDAIYRCAQLHLQHISGGDPFEAGSSRPLDFGHWAAHKLEQLTDYDIRHGEAVAVGIALDVTYSYLSGLLSETAWDRILRVFLELGLPIYVPQLETDGLLAGLSEFREHLGGQLTILLLRGIGDPVEVHQIDVERMRKSSAVLGQYRSVELATSV